MTPPRHVLLVIGGGIAAYKSAELIRLLRKSDIAVTCVLTAGGAHFVTPLTLQSLSENPVHTDLWSLSDESGMGHIQLSRAADLVVVAPASADLIARLATGLAPDLASTLLLATDKPVLIAPAMNVRMWEHPAVIANMAVLRARGVRVVGPDVGPMACGEWGPGRMAEAAAILAAITGPAIDAPLRGRHALVTSGPTREPIDPVRYLANHSSGRQGHAIAAALAAAGARVTLVSGPTALPDPPGVTTRAVETAAQMQEACDAALPADIAVCAAAVADWRVADPAARKISKQDDAVPTLRLVANPDILAGLAVSGPRRPRLLIGFAAETGLHPDQVAAKRLRKGCDWLLANDVSAHTGIMGGEDNEILLLTAAGNEAWPRMPKTELANRLAARIAETIGACA